MAEPAGPMIGCFGLTEPDFGSNPTGMRTSARRDSGDWVLNGTKMWITNGGIADLAVVWARTDDSVLTYEGTSEVHSLILGQALTGLSAFQLETEAARGIRPPPSSWPGWRYRAGA